MTAATIIEQAAADGVRLVMTPAGTIKATGKSEAVSRWLPILKVNKASILLTLELHRLVNEVADFHHFKDEERNEALLIALSDVENALICFRALAGEIPGKGHQ